jgi:Lon protease-like protein
VLALRAELGEPGPAATVDLSVDLAVDDPTLASFRLVALSPLGDLDRQRLLAAPDVADRLARLDGLLDEEEQVCRARLAGS